MSRLRQTHTFVELEVSNSAWNEIAQKLRDAGYDQAFLDDTQALIDMHGIALVTIPPALGGQEIEGTEERTITYAEMFAAMLDDANVPGIELIKAGLVLCHTGIERMEAGPLVSSDGLPLDRAPTTEEFARAIRSRIDSNPDQPKGGE